MNKKLLIIILSVVLVLAGAYYYQQYKSGIYNAKNIPSSNLKSVSKTYVVNLKDSGPEPRSLDISKGDTVKFINNGTRPFWVASDPHPIHNLCPGFDAVHGLIHNESWSHIFKFDAPKTCSYHNHVDVTTVMYRGSINIVK